MISVIVVNYEKYEDTFACVESILKSETTQEFKIIVVDNASPNESWEKFQILKDNEKIVLLKSDENKGYCAGNNIGIKYSLEKLNAEYIWILNPDTLVKKNTLQELYDFAITKEDLGILGCKLVYYPDTQFLQGLGGGDYGIYKYGELKPGPHIFHLEDSKTKLPEVVELDLIIGASMFIPTKVFEKVGFLNERFHLYSDETEFCLRVTKFGFKNYAISAATVYHKEGWRQKEQQLSAVYYTTRNSLFMIKELFPQNIRRNFFISFLRIFAYLKNLKFKEAKYQIKALHDFIFNIDGKAQLR